MRKISIILQSICVSALLCLTAPSLAQNSVSPEITYDWEAQSGEKLSLPIGGGISKTTRIGHMPLKLAFEIHNYIASAERFAPKWLLTFSITPVIGNPKLK